MKIIVTGANGQLGQDVVSILKENDQFEVFSFGREDLDIVNEQKVNEVIHSINPDWILHCAAYTNVEAAEDTGKELNWKVNRDGSAIISKAASKVSAKLIYISTDYVFDGTKQDQYQTNDPTNPLNEYGAAKLAGEKAVLEYSPNAHIIRTSWVFGENGNNFVYTMLKLAGKMDTLKVVNDQFGRPTYAYDLASFMVYIVKNNIPGGVYHFSNDEQATWFEFAKEILKDQDVEVLPVDSNEFPQKATRPKHTIMSLSSVKETGFVIPSWKNALVRFMEDVEK
ncbi:dTDP-4-dehydrorhamnose reductase [Bacillus sp. ISL-35]|uniref:dTDP-4-dehydrorhamnose reductase n=1 Tax=Bacillus sp. ISL-35 TaxID=2819122 RepID=UPI001BE75FC2|nr:dTDP-4-dehydrorhamnose reductase [Bacillus sp. ISL-35]MBT2678839.1 dTDP-4-dehydrorhamnose reductase [Bacillus sp. ISL-35]MBT2703831.1 dTDP-4-dehydrorhamnose reductase [Chryseobacterium sp. ISL-80]